MKELKAYVRTSVVDRVIGALERAGTPGITVSRVHGVGYGYDRLLFTLSPRELKQAPEVTKIEMVCRDEDVERLVAAILESARTGSAGDGIVFVTPVERAIKIRTGAAGPLALEP
jgi:nitrogen regulatory protein P-II 1